MHSSYQASLVVIFLGGLVSIPVSAAGISNRYEIVFSNNQSVMTVMACFKGVPPERLVNHTPGAAGFLKKAYVVIDDLPQALVVRNGTILTDQLHGQECLHYQVDFLRVMQMNRDLRFMPDKNNHVRTQAGYWLWTPPDYDTIDVIFYLDEAYNVTAPWQLIERKPEFTRFRLHAHADNRDSLVFFGRFTLHNLNVGDSELRIAILGDTSADQRQKLLDWVEYGARALTLAYGEFPRPQLSVLVFPIGPHTSVVPWGEVKRNGGTSVYLYVDQTRPLAEIKNDWTLIHELSHTLHPFISMEGRWLSEGLATWYENVLQARAKTLTVQQAWTKLHQGFKRGRAETEPDISLRQVSENMRENRKFMRVYWSGTALWLRADWWLRTQYQTSLDQVMLQFQRCCLLADRPWSAQEFMQQLDQMSGNNIFTGLYEDYARSDRFPDVTDIYTSLGLEEMGEQLSINQNATHADLVHSIMRTP